MTGPEHMIEFMHGYTYSGNPIASAAALATLETYREEGLFERARDISGYWEEGLHSLKDVRNVIDIRNLGLIGAIELDPIAGEPTKRAFTAFLKAYENGLLIRTTGDTIAMSPPLIVEKHHIDEIFGKLREIFDERYLIPIRAACGPPFTFRRLGRSNRGLLCHSTPVLVTGEAAMLGNTRQSSARSLEVRGRPLQRISPPCGGDAGRQRGVCSANSIERGVRCPSSVISDEISPARGRREPAATHLAHPFPAP